MSKRDVKMRTTIEISEELINELLKLSGARKKKDAVRIALEEHFKLVPGLKLCPEIGLR
jgi:Arc/MetJ family transcription regulator